MFANLWHNDHIGFWNVATSLVYLLPFYEAVKTGFYHHAPVYLWAAISSTIFHLDENNHFWWGIDVVFGYMTLTSNFCIAYSFHPNFTKCVLIGLVPLSLFVWTKEWFQEWRLQDQRKWHVLWHLLSGLGTYIVLYEADHKLTQ